MAVQDNYETGGDAWRSDNGGTYWSAQTFTPSSNYNVTSIEVFMYRESALTPTTVTAAIRATSAGEPTGANLASGSIAGSTLTTSSSGAWNDITLSSPYSLSSGTQYAVVVYGSNGVFYHRYDSGGATYSGGTFLWSDDSGATWTNNADMDGYFRTNGTPSFSPPVDIATVRRLVAIGNSRVFYEDI
jgi:hypothetical protein